jgi:hypothetical protein
MVHVAVVLLDPASLLQLLAVALHHVHRPHAPLPPRHLPQESARVDSRRGAWWLGGISVLFGSPTLQTLQESIFCSLGSAFDVTAFQTLEVSGGG